jgi:hypothetical protein
MKTLLKQLQKSNIRVFLIYAMICIRSIFSDVAIAGIDRRDVSELCPKKNIVKEIRNQNLSLQYIKKDESSIMKASFNYQFNILYLLKVNGKIIFNTNFNISNFKYIISFKAMKFKDIEVKVTNIS